jgi:hypothetical protein
MAERMAERMDKESIQPEDSVILIQLAVTGNLEAAIAHSDWRAIAGRVNAGGASLRRPLRGVEKNRTQFTAWLRP